MLMQQAIIRNSAGECMDALATNFCGLLSPQDAEANACFYSLQCARDVWPNLNIAESDALAVVLY